MHGLDLLLSFESSLVQGLVLLLDAADFTLDFLLPLLVLIILPLAVLTLESANFIEFSFFFNFKKGLFNCFGQKHVQNRLHFSIVVKQVIIFNLSEFVDSSLFGHVFRSRRFRNKYVSLTFDIAFFWFFATLLGKEES